MMSNTANKIAPDVKIEGAFSRTLLPFLEMITMFNDVGGCPLRGAVTVLGPT